MWHIRIDKLYSEVGGLISGAEVVFRTPGGHEYKAEGKLTATGTSYFFYLPGERGELEVIHGDRVIVEFEVLAITDTPAQEATA